MSSSDSPIRMAVAIAIAMVAVFGCLALTDQDSDAAGSGGSLCNVTFIANYNGDGVAYGNGDSQTWQVLRGNTIELPTMMYSKTDYVLTHWNVGTYDGESVRAGTERTINGDTTFYGVWEPTTDKGKHRSDFDAQLTIEEPYLKTIDHGSSMLSIMDFEVYSKPDWMTITVDQGSTLIAGIITISGSPTGPGNWIVEFSYNHGDMSYYHYYFVVSVAAETDQMATLSFNVNGGSQVSIAQHTIPCGTAIVLPGQGITTRNGYDMWGWDADDGRGTEVIYALGSVYTATSAIGDEEFMAHWEPAANVIIFNASGAKGISYSIVREGDITTFPTEDSVDYENPGMSLLGWYFEDSPGNIYAPRYEYLVGSATEGAIYPMAYWVDDDAETYHVTYNVNGGTDKVLSQDVLPGNSVVLPTNGFVRSGYTLAGWSETSTGEPLDGTTYQPTKDTTLYAVWEEGGGAEEGQFSVQFNVNGGEGSFPTQTIDSGGYATNPGNPTRDGYIFMGWSPGGTAVWDFENMPITQNLSLSAVWQQHFSVEWGENTASVTINGYWDDCSSTIDWGDDSEPTETIIGSSHTYSGEGRIKITVTTISGSGDMAVTYQSSMDFDLGNIPDDPLEPGEIYAKGQIIDNGDGTYTLSAQGSGNYHSLKWYVNEVEVSTSVTHMLVGLQDGTYNVKLVLTSEDGQAQASWDGQIVVGGDGTDWGLIILIVVVIIVVIAAVLLWRFFL